MIRKSLHTTLFIAFLLLVIQPSTFSQDRKRNLAKLLNGITRPRHLPIPFPPFPNRIHNPFRTFDGTNNNISNAQAASWGAVGIPLFREMPPAYGKSDPNNAMGGEDRPSPRKISNSVIDEPVTTFNGRGLSAFVYVWGQFLDHDMSLTPTGTTEYAPVKLPADEVLFTEDIPFYRSEVMAGTGSHSPRQQLNLNTAWVDASMVYGSDPDRARWLRTGREGKMKTSSGNWLPYNTTNGEKTGALDPNAPDMANDSGHRVVTFVAGDIRAAEHPGIASLHTLFIREHNKICDRLLSQGLRNDEIIYQMARKEVGAIIQAITFEEFLPAIGITLTPYNGYNPNKRPDIANTFATAGYRIGHTMVADDILLFTNDCKEVGPGELDLVEVFWNPQILITYGMEPYLKGFAAHTQYETDTKINSVLRNFLFGSPNDPVRFGIDLGSLNIQRGRDHGLPNYNAVRAFYTGRPARSFSDITSNLALADSIKKLYGNISNVDLWIGILAEDHLPGKSVGRTMHEMLRAQFEKLRDGDFYFYKNDPFLPPKTLATILQTKFSDVLKRNTTLTNLQANVFFTLECEGVEEDDAVASKLSVMGTAEPRIFPNPASTSVTLDLGQSAAAAGTVKVLNAMGVMIRTISVAPGQRNLQINTSDLPAGTYIININAGSLVKSLKLMKGVN